MRMKPLQVSVLIGVMIVQAMIHAAACGKTYSPEKLIYVSVEEESVDPIVNVILKVFGDNEFTIKDVGSEHPLNPESRATRRLFVAKHVSGVEVVINNFYSPQSLHVAFHLMDSDNTDLLHRTCCKPWM